MPIRFNHVWKFNVGDFGFNFGETIYPEPFAVVHNGCYLKFNLLLHPNGLGALDDVTHPGVLVGFWSRNDEYLKLSYRESVIRSDGSTYRIRDWYKSVVFDGEYSEFCHPPIGGSLAELKTKGLLMDNDTKLCVAIELEIDPASFNKEKELETRISSLCYENVGFCAELYTKMMNGDESTDYELVCGETLEKYGLFIFLVLDFQFIRSSLASGAPISRIYSRVFGFNQKKRVEVDWSEAVIEEVRFFLYNDKASEKFADVPLEELSKVAKVLELGKLVAICEKSFMANISEDKAWDFFCIAKTLKMKCLKNKALSTLTEDPNLMDKLMDDRKDKQLRMKVGKFLSKRSRAQLAVQ